MLAPLLPDSRWAPWKTEFSTAQRRINPQNLLDCDQEPTLRRTRPNTSKYGQWRHIQNLVKHLRCSIFISAVHYFRKTFHPRCFTGFLIHLWDISPRMEIQYSSFSIIFGILVLLKFSIKTPWSTLGHILRSTNKA